MRKIIVISFFMYGCFDPVGKQVGIIMPKSDEIHIRTFVNKCPLHVSSATAVKIEDLPAGWCAVPPDVCSQITTEYEKQECK